MNPKKLAGIPGTVVGLAGVGYMALICAAERWDLGLLGCESMVTVQSIVVKSPDGAT
jgi:hypothetical protein